jgi:hypothetical protein
MELIDKSYLVLEFQMISLTEFTGVFMYIQLDSLI